MIDISTRNLHRYSRIQVFLACIVLAAAWFGVFLCIGRVACAPPSGTSTAAPSPAAAPASGGTPPTCFGFHYPGTVTTDTLIWLLASFFPANAILYALYHLLARLREIEHAAEVTKLYYLYADSLPPKSDNEARTQFQNYTRARFWEYYNPWELTAFALGSGVMVVVLAKLVVAKKFGVYLKDPLDTDKLPVAFTAAAGLLGSTLGAMLFALRRYRTFNIYAFTYFQALVAIAAGTFAGEFRHFVLADSVAIFAAFGIAFLAALNIDYMVNLMIVMVAKVTQQPTIAPPQSDLATVILNPDAIDVLNTISVFSIAEFVNTDPMRLYLNLPQSMGAIDGWMDQALLRFHFPNQQQLDAFATAGLRQFSQILNRFANIIRPVVLPYPHADVSWRQLEPAEVIDKINMAQVFATVSDVVRSGRYDRQLAVVSESFRAGRFPPLPAITAEDLIF